LAAYGPAQTDQQQDAYARLKSLVESLQAERDSLRRRLLLINMKNLETNKLQEQEQDDNDEKDLYLWGTGIISSATSVNRVLGQTDGPDKPQRVFSTNLICSFTPDEEYIGSLTL